MRGDAGDSDTARLGALCREPGSGGALRISGRMPGSRAVDHLLEVLGVDTHDLDVIVDLRYVANLSSELIDAVASLLGAMAALGHFRSTSLLAGSIPRFFSQIALWESPRIEEQMWERLVRAGAAELLFGDYGVVHPEPGRGFLSKHAAMKYTCPGHWLYAREPVPAQDEGARGAEPGKPLARAFRVVCQDVVSSGAFPVPTSRAATARSVRRQRGEARASDREAWRSPTRPPTTSPTSRAERRRSGVSRTLPRSASGRRPRRGLGWRRVRR
ncbi:hypothetical protein [Amycolatopsis sp. NPDC051903]|uniref:beta family protein n=1 Tax=Amycolatopsis sp. NPDC051903 TaxID=3363936 RepID=UPI003789D7BE